MPTDVLPPSRPLTPSEAGEIARRGRKLLRAGKVTHHELVLLDTMLWSCRRPNSSTLIVSYDSLQRLAHVSRGTVAKGIAALERLGLLARIKRRALIAWANGGKAWRQLPSAYSFAAPCEFTARTDSQGQEKIFVSLQPADRAVQAAQHALAEVRKRRRASLEARLLGGRSTMRPC